MDEINLTIYIMSKYKINTWAEIDGLFAILKDCKQLLNEFDNVTQVLVNDVVESLKGLDYDELYDWVDTCSLEELYIAEEYFRKDYRLSEVVRIELKRRDI
tara:strand:+ start:128 stop:430 length:303 start_codon:yes stop_codon:yes gene_type:complete